MKTSHIVIGAGLFALAACATTEPPPVVPQPATLRYEEAMATFAEADKAAMPPKCAFLFVGSSSIRFWRSLKEDFPDRQVINRGFGGSHVSDVNHFAERIVIKYKPRLIVFYAGDNDIANGKTPRAVAGDFKAFVTKVQAALPGTRIAFIAIKPSIQRWALVGKVREANALIRQMCERDDRLGFVDVDGPMLGWNEQPRPDLLVEDGLHLSPKGYELWTALTLPFLE
jgi:lysophospholipase L1-like esterase